MRKLVLIVLSIFMCVIAQSQNDTPNLNRDIDEVEVSPPAFTGITNYIDLTNIEANYLQHYLTSNIEYPDRAVKCGNEGTEVIKFNVNALGKVTNIEIVNGICPEIDGEIVRVLESTNGMWKPGKKDGIPVTMEQEVSVVFSIADHPEKASERFLEVATTYFEKGAESFYVKGKSKKAERLFSQGIKYMPYDQSLLLMRGICRFERGNHEGAREDWSRLLELGTLDMNTEYYAQLEGLDSYKAFVAMLEEK